MSAGLPPPLPTSPPMAPGPVVRLPLEWMPFSVSNAYSQGWQLLKRQYGLLLLGTVISVGVSFMGSLVTQLLSIILPLLGVPRGWSIGIASGGWTAVNMLFLSGPFMVSSLYVGVAARREEPIGTRSLLRGFHYFWPSVLLYWSVFVLLVAHLLPAGAAGYGIYYFRNDQPLMITMIVLCSVLGVAGLVLSFYIFARLTPVFFLVADDLVPPATLRAHYRTAWAWTRGQAWPIVGLFITIMLVLAVSFTCFVLPYVFLGAPLYSAVLGVAYVQLGTTRGVFPPRLRCLKCGYDLRGAPSNTCPECGTVVDNAVYRPAGLCRLCGHDMQGKSSGPCPDCGNATPFADFYSRAEQRDSDT